MGGDFDVHGIGMGTRGWPLMRTSVYLPNKESQLPRQRGAGRDRDRDMTSSLAGLLVNPYSDCASRRWDNCDLTWHCDLTDRGDGRLCPRKSRAERLVPAMYLQ